MKDKNKERRKTLHKLLDLNSDIRSKEKERKGSIEFNERWIGGNLEGFYFDIKKLTEELAQLKIEFNVEKRNL